MTSQYDVSVWRLSMTSQYDVSVWRLSMTSQYDDSVWRLSQTLQSDVSVRCLSQTSQYGVLSMTSQSDVSVRCLILTPHSYLPAVRLHECNTQTGVTIYTRLKLHTSQGRLPDIRTPLYPHARTYSTHVRVLAAMHARMHTHAHTHTHSQSYMVTWLGCRGRCERGGKLWFGAKLSNISMQIKTSYQLSPLSHQRLFCSMSLECCCIKYEFSGKWTKWTYEAGGWLVGLIMVSIYI